MKPIAWSQKYTCNIRTIDEDHKALFDTIETLRQRYESNASKDLMIASLESLILYAHDHFEREERFLRRGGYPDYEKHKGEHEEFRALVRALKELYEYTPEIIDMTKVLNFLFNWLSGHILVKDAQYAAFFAKKDPSEMTAIIPETMGSTPRKMSVVEVHIHPAAEQALHDAVRLLNGGGPLADGLERGIRKLIEKGDAVVLAKARKIFLKSSNSN